MAGPQRFKAEECTGADLDVAHELGLCARQPAGQVPRGDALVDSVGLDVLVVERRYFAPETEPAPSVAVAPVGQRRRHLECRQVTD